MANASVTLSFSGTGARAIGFLNANGVAVTGMRYGIIIDSASDGLFSPGNYGSFSNASTGATPINIPLASGFSNDYFYTSTSGNTTVASISASGADLGGAGAIGSLTFAPTQSELQAALPSVFTLTSSYRFGIVWFDTTTNPSAPTYGFYTDSSFILPTSSGSVPFNTPFVGTSGPGDIAKSANIAFAAVPEPSRMILLGFGLVGVFLRRRR